MYTCIMLRVERIIFDNIYLFSIQPEGSKNLTFEMRTAILIANVYDSM